jgi:hypothetical protein
MSAWLERSTTLFAASVILAAGCTPKVSTGSARTSTSTAASSQASAPRIERLVPDSASVLGGRLVEVTIRGTGFAPGQPGTNTVDFSGMKLTSMSANAAGTEIRFMVPDRLVLGGEAPPQPVRRGSYEVRVITSAGTSNMAVFRIFE